MGAHEWFRPGSSSGRRIHRISSFFWSQSCARGSRRLPRVQFRPNSDQTATALYHRLSWRSFGAFTSSDQMRLCAASCVPVVLRSFPLSFSLSFLSPPILLEVKVSLDCFAMLRSASFAPPRHRAGGATTREQLCTRCVDTEAAWRCKQGDAERSLSSWMRAWSR